MKVKFSERARAMRIRKTRSEEVSVIADRKMKLPVLLILVLSAALGPVMIGQESHKPLTNADVIKMVKNGLPESVIISSIQSSAARFDLSPNGLISLHKAGVSQKTMDAMMAAGGSKPPAEAAAPSVAEKAPPSEAAPPPGKTKSRVPVVSIVQNGVAQKIPVEKTQLAQTKNKPTSMAKLATDTAMIQGLQATVNTATGEMARHVSSPVAGSALGQAGAGAFSSILGQRKPKVTYVWAIPNPASTNVLSTDAPQVSVNFSSVPGVNPDEFEPAIVKLTPAQNAFRLVGATQGKEDALSNSSVEWEIYSGFLEDHVKIQSQKLGPGQYQISPASPLLPGEYGVVLRPVSKSKKFSGGDVVRYQGEGMMFDSVWSFQVPASEN
ncbi:MAG: hypothetical protein LAN84_02255 [Acidobacteriia bacterium]|nr:hypothetical protein [Terriglobia bacterium]